MLCGSTNFINPQMLYKIHRPHEACVQLLYIAMLFHYTHGCHKIKVAINSTVAIYWKDHN